MATKTDLEGYLAEGDDSLRVKLDGAFRAMKEGKKKGPWKFRLYAKMIGSQAQEPLLEEVLTQAGGADSIVQKCRKAIVEKYGTDPHLVLRFYLWLPGKAGDRLVDHQRTIRPLDQEGEALDRALLRAELSVERNRVAELHAQLVAQSAQLAAVVQTSHTSIATLGTARGTAAASSDMAGIMQFLALGLLVMMWPTIKKQLGVPKDATLPETMALFNVKLQSAMEAGTTGKAPALLEKHEEEIKPPPGAEDTPEPATALLEGGADADAIATYLESNPLVAMRLMSKLMEHPQAQSMLQQLQGGE